MESYRITKELSNNHPVFDCANALTPLTCKNCTNFTTHKLVHLAKHYRTNHRPVTLEEKNYKCSRCEFQTCSSYTFERHKLFNLCPSQQNTTNIDSVQTKPHRCESCPYETAHIGHLRNHISRKHTSDKRIEWFKCEHCPYQSKVKRCLEEHLCRALSPIWMEHSYSRIERKEHWFQCRRCSYRSIRRWNVRQHEQNLHSNDELRCKKCLFKTNNETRLLRHVTFRHDPDNLALLKCQHCSYECVIKHDWRRPVADAQARRQQCEVITILKKFLEQHILTKHKKK